MPCTGPVYYEPEGEALYLEVLQLLAAKRMSIVDPEYLKAIPITKRPAEEALAKLKEAIHGVCRTETYITW